MKLIAALALALSLGACKPGPIPPPGPSPCDIDPSAFECWNLSNGCSRACQHLLDLDCPVAKPVAGASCTTFCRQSRWNVQCRATAKSCEAAEKCEAR